MSVSLSQRKRTERSVFPRPTGIWGYIFQILRNVSRLMPSRSLISSAVSVSILSSLRGPLVHPRPNLGDSRVDLFERIAQRGQRFEQVVPMKAPEVYGAGVPGVFEKGEPGPHSGGPLCPAGSVAGSRLNVPDMPGKDVVGS